jgi:mannosyl-3-phosphoglycerate phosphatase family protein
MNNSQFIIFTDLDASLLDHSSYSFNEAKPALDIIYKNAIPLILVSSKTKCEVEYYQKELGISGSPFVVENGSAIYLSENYFPALTGDYERVGNYCRFVLGRKYIEIVNILTEITKKYNHEIKGFHNSSEQEIGKLTNMQGYQLKWAMEREFSIPLFYDEKTEEILQSEIAQYDLQLVFGGRFIHLLSYVDKGKAFDLLMKLYRRKYNNIYLKSIAIGDSLNDFPMLSLADYAILIKKEDGSFEKRKILDNIIYSSEIGPRGWNKSLLTLLHSGGING